MTGKVNEYGSWADERAPIEATEVVRALEAQLAQANDKYLSLEREFSRRNEALTERQAELEAANAALIEMTKRFNDEAVAHKATQTQHEAELRALRQDHADELRAARRKLGGGF